MSGSTNLEAFAAALKTAAAAPRVLDIKSLDRTTLAWLALVPLWPESVAKEGLAIDAERVAGGAEALSIMKDGMKRGLLQSGQGEAPWRGTWYWMKALRRTQVIDSLLGESAGLQLLERELARLGRQLGSRPEIGYPPSLERFAALAAATAIEPLRANARMAELLDREVQQALARSTERTETVCPGARRWIDAAAPLARIFGGQLQLATERARRRVELFERRSRDKRHLESYARRENLQNAFLELLDDSADDSWALHYLGDGGMGKTMLIRYITGRLADEKGLVTSHIDFDHINPDYPARAPGLLLLALAEDLKLHEDNTVAEQLRKFDDVIADAQLKVEEAQSSGSALSPDVLRRLSEAEDRFADVLVTISERSRVVLILDTCEELARIRSDGELPESVKKTFDLLGRLHERERSLRVVFSGRRNLASSGYGGWKVESRLPPRDYLRRAVVTGFDKAESESFFTGYDRGENPVPARLRERIRSLSRIDRTGPGGSADSGLFNPYDLNLYASWVMEEGADPDALLAAGTHHYVRERIVNRTNGWIRPWIPYLAKLGDFDDDLLREIVQGPDPDFDPIVNEIRALEWVEFARGTQWSGMSTEQQQLHNTWRVERNLARRIVAFYETDEQQALWRDTLARLREILGREVIDRPWEELSLEYFVVAIETVAADAHKALEWWPKLEAKIADQARWDWGLQIASAVNAREWSERSPMRGAAGNLVKALLLGTEAALRTKQIAPDGPALQSAWRSVADLLTHAPALPGVERLRYRAAAGMVSSLRWYPQPVDESYLGEFDAAIGRVPELPADAADEELLAIEVGFIDNVVEVLEQIDWRGPTPQALRERIEKRIEAVLPRLPDRMCVFVANRHAQLQALCGEESTYRPADLLDPAKFEAPSKNYLDWSEPKHLMARQVLDFARRTRLRKSAGGRGFLPAPLRAIPPTTIDADRCFSALLQLDADDKLPDADPPDEMIEASLNLNSNQPPECVAHRDTPPYFQVALEVRADRGKGREVLQFCDRVAQDSRRPLFVRQAAERVKAYIALRWRLYELGVAQQTSLETSTRVSDRILLAGAAAFHWRSPDYIGRWQRALGQLAQEKIRPEGKLTAAEQQHLHLDELESLADARASDLSLPRVYPLTTQGLAAELRAWALTESVEPQLPCGERLAAALALEEASLMALRRPRTAQRLFNFAVTRFERCDDPIGLLLSVTASLLAQPRLRRGTSSLLLKARRACIARGYDDLNPDLSKLQERAPDPAVESFAFWLPWVLRMQVVEGNLPGLSGIQPYDGVPRDLLNALSAPDATIPIPAGAPSAAAAPRTPSAASAPAPVNKRFAGAFALLANIVGVILGLGFTIVGFGLLFKGYDWVLAKLGVELSSVWKWTSFFGLFVLLGAIPSVLRDAVTLIAKARRERYTIWLSGQEFRVRWSLRGLFTLDPPRSASATFAAHFGETQRYAERPAPPVFQRPTLRERLAKALGAPLTYNVDLVVPVQLAAAPWEALIDRGAGSSLLRFRRTSEPATSWLNDVTRRPMPPFASPPNILLVTHKAGLQTQAQSAWTRAFPTRAMVMTEAQPSERIDVVYILDEIRESSRGLTLELSDGTEVFAKEFQRRFPGVRLVVLQLPFRPELKRFAHDRVEAARARLMAAQLFDAGVACVVVLPSVTEALGIANLMHVIEALKDCPERATKHVVRAAGEAKRQLLAAVVDLRLQESDPENADAWEIPHDVCLYCRWDLSFAAHEGEKE